MTFDPAGFSVRNATFVAVLTLLLLGLGSLAWRSIPRAEDPPFDAPTFAIVAVLPGAPPADVESRVLEPIEERLRALDDLESLTGTAATGVATLQMEFTLDGTSPDDRYALVLREIESARAELPAELARLDVLRLRPDRVNALIFALVAPTASWVSVRDTAERLEAAIEAVPGVAGATIDALPAEQVEIAVDAEALAAIGVPVDAVLQAVASNDLRIPGGTVDVGPRRLAVTTESDWAAVPDLEQIAVTGADGVPLRLGDVATVARGSADRAAGARWDGARAVWIGVTLEPEANVFDTTAAVRAAADGVAVPPGQRLEVAFDQSSQVAHRLSGFSRDFLIAIGLVLLTLLPLGGRASGVVMVAIPLSLLMGLAGLYALGFTLNQLSIVGFVISLGLLVDDAIVVVENVARHLRKGRTPREAAIEGTREISVAVLGCTATLLLAFVPLLALPGTAGLFIRSLPVTVVVTITASLVLSLTVVPLLASRLLVAEVAHGNRWFRLLEWAIERSFRPVLGVAMARPMGTLLAAAALVGGALALVPTIGFSLFPKAEVPLVRVLVDAGDGASWPTTDAVVARVVQHLHTLPEVRHTMASTGEGTPRVYYNIGKATPHAGRGEVLVLLDGYDPEQTPALLDTLRATFTSWPGADVQVREFEQGPPLEAPVAIRLLGTDLDRLTEGSAAVAAALRSVDGLVDIDDPLAHRRTDLVVRVDRGAAALLGVAPVEVARVVRFGLAGLEVGTLRDPEGDELPIVARLVREGTAHPADLQRLYVHGSAGPLPLGDVARVELQSGVATIPHRDGTRTASVTANVATGRNTDRLTRDAVARMATVSLPEGVRWEVAGEAESRSESFDGMGMAALIAAFGVLAVLVLEFGTLRSTLVVASVVPLGVAGGLVALFLTGNTLSFTAAIGFVALMGIEVKNSILLVDFANQLRRSGMAIGPAIARAGETRFVPILLTTLTALGGLVPLAAERSALYSPLALVLIGGLIASTLLARVVTPVVYLLLDPPVAPEHDPVYATVVTA